jgi:8-oxo-dGTP diphosphatase
VKDATLCFVVQGGPFQKVLLGLKKVGFGQGKFDGFGGKIEAGETPLVAAIRELEEESGLRATPEQMQYVAHLVFVFPAKPEWSQIVHAFVATQWTGTPAESVEMIPTWFDLQDIPYPQMWDDSTYWLPRILAGGRLQGRFVFQSDNATVGHVVMEPLDELAAAQLAAQPVDVPELPPLEVIPPGDGSGLEPQVSPLPCYILRRIRMAHCKRGPALCEQCRQMDVERICLLDICPPHAGEVQRRVIAVRHGAEQVWREFDVVRTFESEAEARQYAVEHGIEDVEL